MDLVKIGKYIASKRKSLGMTQKQLAEKLGMSDKSVSKWERGQFEGKTYEQLKKNAAYIKWLKSGGITAFQGGEDQEEFRKRCVEGMKKQVRFLIARHVKYAAFVVHGGTIMAVLSSLTGGEYFDFQVKNGEGYETVLEWIQGRWKITSLTKIGCEDSKSEHLQ